MRTGAEIFAFTTLVMLLALVALEDLRSQTIPDPLNAALVATGFVFAYVTSLPGIGASIIGAIVGGAFLAAVAMAFRRLRGKDGLGFGDVKFLAGAGAWVGWQGLAPLIFMASVSAIFLAGAQYLRQGRFDRDTPLAFGPHLSLATLIVWTLQAYGMAPWRVGG